MEAINRYITRRNGHLAPAFAQHRRAINMGNILNALRELNRQNDEIEDFGELYFGYNDDQAVIEINFIADAIYRFKQRFLLINDLVNEFYTFFKDFLYRFSQNKEYVKTAILSAMLKCLDSITDGELYKKILEFVLTTLKELNPKRKYDRAGVGAVSFYGCSVIGIADIDNLFKKLERIGRNTEVKKLILKVFDEIAFQDMSQGGFKYKYILNKKKIYEEVLELI